MAAAHKNMTVTRTISAGNSTRTSESESAGFPFARRHSSAGMLALKWATARSCSFGSSLGLEIRGSKDSTRSFVVTPDSIPPFTIPKLALEDRYRSRANEKEGKGEEEVDWGSSEDISGLYHARLSLSSSVSSSSSSSSSSGFSISPIPGRKAFSDLKHCSDPASQAALSLPHLPKVTTPYGFVTLSKSPEMADEEALFSHGHRRWGHDEEVNTSRHPKLGTNRTPPIQTHNSTPPLRSPVARRFFRSHSVTGIEVQRQLALNSEPVKPAPVNRIKRGLWGILCKQKRNSFDFNLNLKGTNPV